MNVAGGMTFQDRPARPARSDYRPSHPQEEFIVPLLKARIEQALARHGRPALSEARRTALDVGCGRQPFRVQIEQIGFSYSSLDARQSPEGTVDFVCAIDEELPESLHRAAPFGLVLCTELMEHVADWRVAFANLSRLTDLGGIVIVTCPFVFPLHEEPYDFWRPTPYALRHFAAGVGFDVVESDLVGNTWDVVGTVLGSVLPYPPGPSAFSRFAGVIRRRALSSARWVLRKRILHRLIPLRGPIYLSNIFILKRI